MEARRAPSSPLCEDALPIGSSFRWRTKTSAKTSLDSAVFFAELDEPFARLFKALAARIDLFVGVPAGPLHFVLARGGVPAIGLWVAHHPDWYDEPNPNAIQVVGRYVRDRGFDRRVATTSKPQSLRHRLCYLDSATIGAEPVLEAASQLV